MASGGEPVVQPSIVEWIGRNEASCGYCRSKDDTSLSDGMWSHVLRVSDYQRLIDRGWRRSGRYCYKPCMAETCCPLYTIRLDALQYTQHRSTHKRVLRRAAAFLRSEASASAPTSAGTTSAQCPPSQQNPAVSAMAQAAASVPERATPTSSASTPSPPMQPSTAVAPAASAASKPGKAKERRRQRAIAKGRASKPSSTASGDGLWSSFQQAPGLSISIVPAAFREEAYQVFKRYQMAIHGDAEDEVSVESYTRFLCNTPLPLTPTLQDDEDFASATAPSCGYGSFHFEYRLKGRLIAVGVNDILPLCLSSVYFFYDPSCEFPSLGTYGALQEIAWVQDVAKTVPQLHYYYMGYYVHDCVKMRYKGQFQPSMLLCPETYLFTKWERCMALLDRPNTRSTRLAEDAAAQHQWQISADKIAALSKRSMVSMVELFQHVSPGHEEQFREFILTKSAVLYDRTMMPFSYLPTVVQQRERKAGNLKRYGELVGPALVTRIAYFVKSASEEEAAAEQAAQDQERAEAEAARAAIAEEYHASRDDDADDDDDDDDDDISDGTEH